MLTLKSALREHHLLVIAQQQLSDAQFLHFTSYFGTVSKPPAGALVLACAAYGANTPDIVLCNDDLTGHSDHHWTPQPSASSLLYALEVPRRGGETTWHNEVLAYEELDEATSGGRNRPRCTAVRASTTASAACSSAQHGRQPAVLTVPKAFIGQSGQGVDVPVCPVEPPPLQARLAGRRGTFRGHKLRPRRCPRSSASARPNSAPARADGTPACCRSPTRSSHTA